MPPGLSEPIAGNELLPWLLGDLNRRDPLMLPGFRVGAGQDNLVPCLQGLQGVEGLTHDGRRFALSRLFPWRSTETTSPFKSWVFSAARRAVNGATITAVTKNAQTNIASLFILPPLRTERAVSINSASDARHSLELEEERVHLTLRASRRPKSAPNPGHNRGAPEQPRQKEECPTWRKELAGGSDFPAARGCRQLRGPIRRRTHVL